MNNNGVGTCFQNKLEQRYATLGAQAHAWARTRTHTHARMHTRTHTHTHTHTHIYNHYHGDFESINWHFHNYETVVTTNK